MLENKYNKLYVAYGNNMEHLYEPSVGDKLYDANDPYDRGCCYKIESALRQAGFITKTAQNIENQQWSVAIVGRIIVGGEKVYEATNYEKKS